jgi:transposase
LLAADQFGEDPWRPPPPALDRPRGAAWSAGRSLRACSCTRLLVYTLAHGPVATMSSIASGRAARARRVRRARHALPGRGGGARRIDHARCSNSETEIGRLGNRQLDNLPRAGLRWQSPPPEVARFAVPPRRWVLKRTFAWLGRSRRLSKDYEYLTATSEAVVQLAMIQLLLRRLTRVMSLFRRPGRGRRSGGATCRTPGG